MLQSKRMMASTAGLLLFLATAIYLHWQWLSLIVPGAVLTWIGLVLPPPSPAVPSSKKLAK